MLHAKRAERAQKRACLARNGCAGHLNLTPSKSRRLAAPGGCFITRASHCQGAKLRSSFKDISPDSLGQG